MERIRFNVELPFFIRGVPSTGRNKKTLMFKRTETIDLGVADEALVERVARITNARLNQCGRLELMRGDTLDIFQIDGGVYVPSFRIGDRRFISIADGFAPAAYEIAQARAANHGVLTFNQIVGDCEPKALAHELHSSGDVRKLDFPEFAPQRVKSIDDAEMEKKMTELRDIVSSHKVVGDWLFRPVSMPCILVERDHMNSRIGLRLSDGPIAELRHAINIFPLSQHLDGIEYADRIADETGWGRNPDNVFEVTTVGDEHTIFNMRKQRLELIARKVLKNFERSLTSRWWIGDSIVDVPPAAYELARELALALRDLTDDNSQRLESCIEEAICYGSEKGIFIHDDDASTAVMFRDFEDRDISISEVSHTLGNNL